MDCRHLAQRMVLIGAAGIKPRDRRDRRSDAARRVALRPRRFPRRRRRSGGFSGSSKKRSTTSPTRCIELWDLSTEMTARVCLEAVDVQPRVAPSCSPGVPVPTAVVWGEDDQLFPIDIGHQYVEQLPDARLHLVADAGHWVDLEQPEALAEIVRGLR